MENVKEFFEKVLQRIEDESFYYQPESELYPMVENFDYETLYVYKYSIANKLLMMSDENRKYYAKFILESIDILNVQNRFIAKEKIIYDENNNVKRIYILCKIHENLIDVTSIWDYCYMFVSFVWEAFMIFGIDLKDLVKEKNALRGDYSFLFYDTDYIRKWALEQQEKVNGARKEYKKWNEFTAERQLLAIETMLSELEVVVRKKGRYSEGQFDKTTFAAFLQFLTGREADSEPKNTRFYKMINNEGRLDRTNYNEDCDFVANYFIGLNLNDLAEKIQKGK